MLRIIPALALLLAAGTANGETLVLGYSRLTEWKAVYGRIESRDTVPARARIGGVVVELLVSEGDDVVADQKIAVVRDDKIEFEIAALDAQLRAHQSQFETASADLERARSLVDKGVMTVQRLDQLRNQVEVTRNQIAATEAQRRVLVQRNLEGQVLAPAKGRILAVPVTRGAVVLAGERVATIGGGGFFLRLAIPERHAVDLVEGARIQISSGALNRPGTLAKVYPQIENGRVIADVEVPELDTGFVDARVLVEVPVGERQALLVPAAAIATRYGIDFVTVTTGERPAERAVVTGARIIRDDGELVEILSGLSAGDTVVLP
ncbi:MAG: efflux RND transporter periplasmic adaptor subunit [Pseudomonadota bacterium]|nr:efflux RND transporter periplasmic adaptor subunit [Pseudomonadota bacterium]